jgi:hypothetical protein
MIGWMPIEVFGVTAWGLSKTSNDECGDPSPFDCAQGQDDDVKTNNDNCNDNDNINCEKQATAKQATAKQATTKCGDPSLRSG